MQEKTHCILTSRSFLSTCSTQFFHNVILILASRLLQIFLKKIFWQAGKTLEWILIFIYCTELCIPYLFLICVILMYIISHIKFTFTCVHAIMELYNWKESRMRFSDGCPLVLRKRVVLMNTMEVLTLLLVFIALLSYIDNHKKK